MPKNKIFKKLKELTGKLKQIKLPSLKFKSRKVKKWVIFTIISAPISVFFVVILANYSVAKIAENQNYDDITKIKSNNTGLVLGTVKTLRNGQTNYYFTYRVRAAVKLYKAGKIKNILVSGDNSREGYDEPTDFKNELIKNGVPESRIYLDYAGFRTLDSVVRAKEVFGQTEITIISQKFHNERAIFLAENFGINAVGFNAKDITGKYGLKVKIREYLARVKVYLDVIFGVQPKFLGDKIKIKNHCCPIKIGISDLSCLSL